MVEKKAVRPGVRAGYDLWSATYDETPNPVVAVDGLYTVDLLDPRPGEAILDAGCGTGRHLVRLLAAGARPVGLDFSSGMLRVAQARSPGIPVIQADLQAPLPLASGCFHAVLCALIGEHLDRLAFTLIEFFRVLRPGGRLIFSVYHPVLAEAGKEANFQLDGTEYRLGAVRYGTSDYQAMMRAAGFAPIETREFTADRELVNRPVILALRAARPDPCYH